MSRTLGKNRVAGLLLAAGASTRMGEPKQLLKVGGKILLGRVLGQALDSGLDLVALVLGAQAQEIMEAIGADIHHPKLRIIKNKNYRGGISTSIVAGLSAVEEDFDNVMVILADMPQITSDLINQFLRQYTASELSLGAIEVKGKRSHPVIIGRPFYEELHHLRGDVGARDLFQKYSDQVCLVEPEEEYNDTDIDSRQDYLEFKSSLED